MKKAMILGLLSIVAISATPARADLEKLTYEPMIVPPGQIRAVAMLEANCVSCSLKIVAPGKHIDPTVAFKFAIDFSAVLWCRDADTVITLRPVSKTGLTAKEVVVELREFVDAAMSSPAPMETGRWILAAEAGHLLTQLKQTIKKSYRIMGSSSAAARKKVGEKGKNIVDDILVFEKAAVEFDKLGQGRKEMMLKKEYYDRM